MKRLRNINPLGYVDLPLIRREGASDDPGGDQPGSGCLVPGEVFEVSDEHAGVAPHWRPSEEGDADPDGVIRRFETRVDDDLLEVLDPGHGLLAQVGNYELVKGDQFDGMKVDELKKYAEEHGIDLGDATKKAEILAAIRKG